MLCDLFHVSNWLGQAIDPSLASSADERWQWAGAALIVVVGLLVYGWRDLIRLNARRIWAISSVVQVECIRRRVLWLTPLAIIGVIIVSQFQVATGGPEDAIRQTTKFCIFAGGLLVGMTAIILASTNLPREIENRVIFTIVTKPTTRLEIVLGKIVGFARVSGLIILIMGIFTLAYLEFRARPLLGEIKAELNTLPADSPKKSADLYYVNSGLLGTRSIEWSDDMQIYSEPPYGQERWALGGIGQYILATYDLNEDQRSLLAQAAEAAGEFFVSVHLDMDARQLTPSAEELREARDARLEAKTDVPFGPTTEPAEAQAIRLLPQASVRFLDFGEHLLVPMSIRDAGSPINLKADPADPQGPLTGSVKLSREVVEKIAAAGKVKLQISPRTPAMEFGVRGPVTFLTIDKQGMNPIRLPMAEGIPPVFGSHPGRTGNRLVTVHEQCSGPVAVYAFHNVKVGTGGTHSVGIQVMVAIERGGEFKEDPNHPQAYATATLQVVNRSNGKASPQINFAPETSRSQPVLVDASYFEGGNFDVLVRNMQRGQTLGLQAGADGTIGLVVADHSFVLNLIKSLFILWLLSILIIIIAIFCSTFVSWPIAVVMTVVILLAHWTVIQLGDALNPGAGRGAAVGFGLRDPNTMQIVSNGFDRLSAMLKMIAAFLPDVSRFPVIEDIQHGISIPPADVAGALEVIVAFGLPMVVLSYVILRRKEVAP